MSLSLRITGFLLFFASAIAAVILCYVGIVIPVLNGTITSVNQVWPISVSLGTLYYLVLGNVLILSIEMFMSKEEY